MQAKKPAKKSVQVSEISDIFKLKEKVSPNYLKKISKKGKGATEGNFFLCDPLKANMGNYTSLDKLTEQLKQSIDPLVQIYVSHDIEDFGFVVIAMSEKLQEEIYDSEGDRIAWIEPYNKSFKALPNEYLCIKVMGEAAKELVKSKDAFAFAEKLNELSTKYSTNSTPH